MMAFALLILAGVEGIRWISPTWSGSSRQLVLNLAGTGLGGAAAIGWRRMRPRVSRNSRVRVLVDVPRGSWRNIPYLHELIRRMPKEIEIIGFDRRFSVLGAYDVVHSHWPEHRLRSADWGRRMRNRGWWLLWVTRLHVQGIPVVRTQHNRRPHDPGPRLERVLVGLFQLRVRARIWLTEFSRAESGTDSNLDVVIPHGDYRPWIGRMRPDGVAQDRTPGRPVRLLSLGIIRRYKNFEESIVVVSRCKDFTMSIMGASTDPDYTATIADLAGIADNVNLVVGRVADQDLIDEVLAADAVLLTYRDLYNSGVVFLALSLGRPVIVRNGPAARELQREYGPEWVGTYEGPLTSDGLRRAWHSVARTTGAPVGSPDRAWPKIVRAHAQLYRRVARAH
jgi:beta-1,4-mannosyltransferase